MRSRSFSCQRLLAVFFCSLFALVSVVAPASAAMVSTEQLLGVEDNLPAPAEVRASLQARLVAMGVPSDDAQQRVAALNDQQVIQVATALDEDPAGGGIVTVAAVIFLVLLWTDIMGYTDVFPFVNKSPNGSQGPIVTEN